MKNHLLKRVFSRLLFDENNGRRRFVREIQHYILSSSTWDETILEIAGLK